MERELRKLGQKFDEQVVREVVGQERLVECYAGLAAVGQMTAMTLPEISRDIERLSIELDSLRAKLRSNGDLGIQEEMDRLSKGLDVIMTRLQLLHHATGVGERRRAIDIEAELETYRQLIQPVLDDRGVRLEVDYPSGQIIRTEMRPENFHCLLQILTENSLNWMNGDDPRRIRIVVSCADDQCELVFSDSGPGIPCGLSTRVFEPGFSTREGGRGMGLTIGRRLVESHGGKISLILDGRRVGAEYARLAPSEAVKGHFPRQGMRLIHGAASRRLPLRCRGTVPGLPGSGVSSPVEPSRPSRIPHATTSVRYLNPLRIASSKIRSASTACFTRDSLAASYSPTYTHRECALTLVKVARLTRPLG